MKHFKNVPRGKRRIHQRPNSYEIQRCRWWLNRELTLIKPRLTIALGATAASALAGRAATISKVRGRLVTFREGVAGFVTIDVSSPTFGMLRVGFGTCLRPRQRARLVEAASRRCSRR